MLKKYLPSKLYSVHQKSPEKTMKWFFFFWHSLGVSNQQCKKKDKAMEVGHDSWLKQLCGVVLRRGRERPLLQLHSCRIYAGPQRLSVQICIAGIFFFFTFGCPIRRFFLHLNEQVLMAFDKLTRVFCFLWVLWVCPCPRRYRWWAGRSYYTGGYHLSSNGPVCETFFLLLPSDLSLGQHHTSRCL